MSDVGPTSAEPLSSPDSLAEQPSVRGLISADTDTATASAAVVDAGPTVAVQPVSADADAGSLGVPRGMAWARRYVAVLAGCDAVVGALAVLGALFFRPAGFDTWKMVVLVVGAALAWPLAIAASRGYERGKIGVGGRRDAGSVGRALILAIAVSAIPCAITGQYGVVGGLRDRRFRSRPWPRSAVRFARAQAACTAAARRGQHPPGDRRRQRLRRRRSGTAC